MTLSNTIKTLALAISFAGAAGMAVATTVNFGGAPSNNLGQTVDYGDFTVSASYGGSFNFGGVYVSRGAGGLGVNGSPDTTPGYVDGYPNGSWEALTFNFDHTVTLTGVQLSGIDSDDEYDIFIDGGYVGTDNASSWSGALLVDSLTIAAVGRGSEGDRNGFGIYPVAFRAKVDEFQVHSISYDPAPIPLPASGVLLLAGIGGLAAYRRRAKAAA